MEIPRAKRVGELERAEHQAAAELEHTRTAKAKLKEAEVKLREAEAELFSYQSRLNIITLKVRGAEERAENAEEVARMDDAKAVKMASVAWAAEEKAAAAKRAAAEAVRRYRDSDAFLKDMAEASIEVYVQGFRERKEKAACVFNIPDLSHLKPDGEEPEGLPSVRRSGGDGSASADA